MTSTVTIDTITHDPANDELVLYLVEDGPWPASEEDWRACIRSIQDRILSAVEIAVDGGLTTRYPDSVGKGVRIQIDSPAGCPAPLEELVEAVARFLREDPSYAAAIEKSLHIRSLRVVTGTEMGRFGGR
jgi:hypothetical protein